MPTVTSELFCRVMIHGTAREPLAHPTLGPLPAIPEDGGEASALWEWLASKGIAPARNNGPHPGGSATFDALFRPDDAARVLTFLVNRGVTHEGRVTTGFARGHCHHCGWTGERKPQAEAGAEINAHVAICERHPQRAVEAERDRLAGALRRLHDAADPFLADQTGASDPRCGTTQPVTVAECMNLTDAVVSARAVLPSLNEPAAA